MVTVFCSFSVASLVRAQTVPFGGMTVTLVPPTPLCPVTHALIFDFATMKSYGLTLVPSSIIYLYGLLYQPGAYLLGSYLPTPIPCAVPYPIYPVHQIGTS